MASCNFCGKKMGILENQCSVFDGDSGVCIECYRKIKSIFKPEIEKMIKEQYSEEDIVSAIAEKHSVSGNGVNYLKIYINIMFNNDINMTFEERQKLLAEKKSLSLKITTGYTFEGYRITDYKGIVSGETVIGTGFLSEFLSSVDDMFGSESKSFAGKMRQVKEAALTNLKSHAVQVGGNAVIGIDFDYLMFSSNMIGVSANGTAVTIEKIE